MALGSIRDIYSQNTLDTEKKLKEIEAAKPGVFQSNYGTTLNGLMDKIVNQKDFSYDFNADAMYQQYKDNYSQLGKQAMMDTAANAAALSGGFNNSYATTAAAQANQQYLSQLNNVIPELYQLALDKYQLDTDRLYNQYSVVSAQDDREYGRYQDKVSNWQNDRNYYADKMSNAVSNDQYVSNYNQSENQWQQNFDYQKEQDAWSNQFQQNQFDYQKEQDAWSQQFQQSQFDYQKEQDAKDYALRLASLNSSGGSGGSSGGSSGNSSRNNDSDSGSTLQKVNTQYVNNKGQIVGVPGSGTSKMYNTVANVAVNMATTGNSDSVSDYLAKQLNAGTITETEAALIKSRAEKTKSSKAPILELP